MSVVVGFAGTQKPAETVVIIGGLKLEGGTRTMGGPIHPSPLVMLVLMLVCYVYMNAVYIYTHTYQLVVRRER